MDFESNAKFFDKVYRKKNKRQRAIGGVASGIGGACVVLSMIGGWGYFFWILRTIGWPILIFGVIVLLVAMNRHVKESDVTSQTDGIMKEFKDGVNEALDYPKDFDEKSISFFGCYINDENIGETRRLRSGNFITKEMTFSLFYETKAGVYIKQKKVSLVDPEGTTEEEKTLSFSDFDKAGVEIDTLKNGVKISYVRFYKDNSVCFEAPLTDNDYYKEEYFNTLMHDKERLEKSAK